MLRLEVVYTTLTTCINTYARVFVEEFHSIRTKAALGSVVHGWFIRTVIVNHQERTISLRYFFKISKT